MAELQGLFYKNIIGGMLSATLVFPEYKKLVDGMKDEEWYDWDKFCTMTREVGEKVTPQVMVTLGKKVASGAKELFASQGLDSTEKILKNLNTLFLGAVRNAPKWQRFDTESYENGKAVCITTVPQPISLIEGYLRGYVSMYGSYVKNVVIEEVKGQKYTTYKLTITW